MDQLDAPLHEMILSNLNPRDVARAGGVNKALRAASHNEFHNIVNNPHVTRVAERYKSKLRAPMMAGAMTVSDSLADLPERNRFGQGTQFRGERAIDVGGGQQQTHQDGDRTFAGRTLKHFVDHTLEDRIGRAIDRGR